MAVRSGSVSRGDRRARARACSVYRRPRRFRSRSAETNTHPAVAAVSRETRQSYSGSWRVGQTRSGGIPSTPEGDAERPVVDGGSTYWPCRAQPWVDAERIANPIHDQASARGPRRRPLSASSMRAATSDPLSDRPKYCGDGRDTTRGRCNSKHHRPSQGAWTARDCCGFTWNAVVPALGADGGDLREWRQWPKATARRLVPSVMGIRKGKQHLGKDGAVRLVQGSRRWNRGEPERPRSGCTNDSLPDEISWDRRAAPAYRRAAPAYRRAAPAYRRAAPAYRRAARPSATESPTFSPHSQPSANTPPGLQWANRPRAQHVMWCLRGGGISTRRLKLGEEWLSGGDDGPNGASLLSRKKNGPRSRRPRIASQHGGSPTPAACRAGAHGKRQQRDSRQRQRAAGGM